MTPFNKALLDALPKLRIYARYLTRDPSLAEDLVQEACARALRFRDKFVAGTNMAAWLNTIARNLNHSQGRRAGLFVQGEDWQLESRTCPPDAPARIELAEVSRAVAAMTANHQRAIHVVGWEGEDYAEAAQILNIPIGTVKSRVHRVRQQLAGQFDRPAGYGPREAN